MRTALLLMVVSIGCGSDSQAPAPDAADADQHVDLVSDPYTLQPGDEKYFCYTMTLPADKDLAITKLTPTYGAGTHHILVAQTIAPEPEGFSECNVLIRTTWIPLYGGGLNSGPLEMPANTGMKTLQRGQQILMQLHLQNATDAPITASTAMRIDLVEATADVIPASLYGLDNRKISVPPHSTGVTTEMSCQVGRDLSVFALMGHMHKRGVHLDLSRGAAPGADMLYEEDWKFETQPVTPITLSIAKGEMLYLRCTHSNETDTLIEYGESSDTEMCAMVMYYAPAQGLDGCVSQ
jgi:hypothetical protein